MLAYLQKNSGGGGGAAAVTGSQLPKSGQDTSYKPVGTTAGDDGTEQAGTTKSYTANTTGQYSGTTNITVNSKTEVKTNNTVTDNVTNLMWTKGVSASVGAGSDGQLEWDDSTSLVNGTYRWTASGSGTNEYYLELAAGGNPSITEPQLVAEADSFLTAGTVGSLAASEWDYGDNDTLGFSTIYVRLSDGTDPDAGGTDHVQMSDGENIFYYCDQANAASLAGHTDWRVPNCLEYLSIANWSGSDGKPDTTYFDSITQLLWTSQIKESEPTKALYAWMQGGRIDEVAKASTVNEVMLVRNAS